MAELHYLPGAERAICHPIADVLYVGSARRKHAELHAAGRLSPSVAVIDASQLTHQKLLVDALRSDGVELLLDAKVAELSSLQRFEGAVRHAPWAKEGQPLQPSHFTRNHRANIIGQIARCAVAAGFHAILAPTHFLKEGSASNWFSVDRDACLQLRQALDAQGGGGIGIDYPLLLPHTSLLNEAQRGDISAGLADLPYDNLYIRASGFGADGAPSATRRCIQALSNLNNIGKPIVADHVAGLVGLASLAFGASAGIAHGLGEAQRFNARDRHKPHEPSTATFGRTTRIRISGSDKALTKDDLRTLHGARGGRRAVTCDDRNCCPSFESMLDHPHRHDARLWQKQVAGLAAAPNLGRTRHFLVGKMTAARRKARTLANLDHDNERLKKGLMKEQRRLENFSEERGSESVRSAPVIHRVPDGLRVQPRRQS